uniref:Uncharacterized protein n=1 Tax=Romanomermis culicivorax TaxID=13658 RepID=A0A915J1M8_ROMCU
MKHITRPNCQFNLPIVKTKRDVDKKNYDDIFDVDVTSKILEVLEYPIEFYANRSLMVDSQSDNQASCVLRIEIQTIAALSSCLICINIMALALA